MTDTKRDALPPSYDGRTLQPLSVERVRRLLGARYTVVRELGAGGAAIVYLAKDAERGTPVAVKVLRPELSAAVVGARFLREIEIGQRMQHPNVLPVYEFGTSEGELYCTMPFVDGETLRHRLTRETQLSIGDTLRIARAVASALDYAHHLDIVHRDIKPANVLLDSGRVIVADFGIARAMSAAATNELTESGMVLGTTAYMSPEQGTGERNLTGRADVYALGCTVYEMLAGEPPFTGPTPLAVISRHCQEPPRSIQIVRPTVPLGVQRAVEKALAKLPADRFATAGQFVDAMEEGARGETTAAMAVSSTAPTVRHPRALVAWAAVATIALGIAGTAWWRAAHAPLPRPVHFSVEPPPGLKINHPGSGHDIALSRDGQSLAFFAGPRRLHLYRFDGTPAIAFPKVHGTDLHFSPDGHQLAFMDRGPSVVPFGPGDAAAEPVRLTMANFGTMYWTFAADIVYFSADTIWRIASTGGAPHMIAARNPATDLRWRRPVLLSDGKTLSFRVMSRTARTNDDERVVLMSIEGGAYTPLELRARDIVGYQDGVLVFSQSAGPLDRGRLLAVRFDLSRRKVLGEPVVVVDSLDVDLISGAHASLSDDGTLAYLLSSNRVVLQVADQRGNLTPLQRDTADYSDVSWSPEGKRIVFQKTVEDRGEIFVLDVEKNTIARITHSGGIHPEWTPDGLRITFVGWDTEGVVGGPAMWAPADGSGDVEPIPGLGALGAWVDRIALAPGGKFFVLGVGDRPTASAKLASTLAVPLGGGAPIRLFSGMGRLLVSVSPDGRFMAYAEEDGAGGAQVFVRPFPTGEGRVQITRASGSAPQWSPDGRRLYFRQGINAMGVATLDVSGALPRVVHADSIPIARTASDQVARSAIAAPDNTRLAIARDVGSRTRILVVTNWRTELREKLGIR